MRKLLLLPALTLCKPLAVVLCGIAALICSMGVTGTVAAERHGSCVDDPRIVPGQRISSAVIGMTVQEVAKRFQFPANLPPFKTQHSYVLADGGFFSSYVKQNGNLVNLSSYRVPRGGLELPSNDFSFTEGQTLIMYFAATDRVTETSPEGAALYVGRVRWVGVLANAACRTATGIHVGSTLAEVQQAYGAPRDSFGPIGLGDRAFTVLVYDDDRLGGGILFVVSAENVIDIAVFAHNFCDERFSPLCSKEFHWTE